MWQQIAPAFRMMLVLTVLSGLIYPGVVTGLCQVFPPRPSHGSLVSANGRVVGSSLLGQKLQEARVLSAPPVRRRQ